MTWTDVPKDTLLPSLPPDEEDASEEAAGGAGDELRRMRRGTPSDSLGLVSSSSTSPWSRLSASLQGETRGDADPGGGGDGGGDTPIRSKYRDRIRSTPPLPPVVSSLDRLLLLRRLCVSSMETPQVAAGGSGWRARRGPGSGGPEDPPTQEGGGSTFTFNGRHMGNS